MTASRDDAAPASPVLDTREGYDRWAAIYDDDANPLVALEAPHVRALLGEVAGLRAVDVGCGTGRHALELAAQGADVTALDFSAEMLRRAAAKPGAERVRWVQHDLALPLPLPDRAFDRVVCGLVVDHIRGLEALFRELGRVCRGDGAIVVSTIHPAMNLRGVQARFTDPATGVKTMVASCRHTVSDYVRAALAAGLRIQHLGEHEMTAEIAERLPRAAPYVGWPMLFVMRLAV